MQSDHRRDAKRYIGVIRFVRDYYKPRFDTGQVSDIKSVLDLFGDDKQSHRVAGNFLYFTAK